MARRESFFIGDRPTLLFECRRPDPHRFDDSDGLPADPYKAEYKVFNKTSASLYTEGTEETEIVDTFGMEGGYVHIEPANEEEDRGALLTLRFPADLFDIPGTYTIFLSTYFKDNPDDPDEEPTRITEDYSIKISEYR